jgi:hypothetical protein
LLTEQLTERVDDVDADMNEVRDSGPFELGNRTTGGPDRPEFAQSGRE